MTTKQVLDELKKAGSEQTKKTLLNHGAKEPFYGVKISDMKLIQKKIKDNKQQIACELFDSGIGDAQYLAGLIADGSKMTKAQLQSWADRADWAMISEYSVAWVASENPGAFELALKWIDSKKDNMASSGWNTINAILATWPDEKIDTAAIRKLLQRVEMEIDKAPDRTRYCMNNFIISTGIYMKELNKEAVALGKKLGPITVNMQGTDCKVPYGPDYIKKAMDKGMLGKKRKTAKC
jgi:3-methyladenine DNA glycosylase AlkD